MLIDKEIELEATTSMSKFDVCEVIDGVHANTLGLYIRCGEYMPEFDTVDHARPALIEYARWRDIDVAPGVIVTRERWRKIPRRTMGEATCAFQRHATGRGTFEVWHLELEKWE